MARASTGSSWHATTREVLRIGSRWHERALAVIITVLPMQRGATMADPRKQRQRARIRPEQRSRRQRENEWLLLLHAELARLRALAAGNGNDADNRRRAQD
ncbi:MAG: hypothetical protein U1E76_06740 [Planctomycetota bacterium]